VNKECPKDIWWEEENRTVLFPPLSEGGEEVSKN
jgi:hypothetical protein